VASFSHLLAPGRIGAMTVRNRMVMPPMETMHGTPDGLPSQRTRDYSAALAKGGVGLITLGANGVDNHHLETPGGMHLGTDDAVDAHRVLIEVVHEHGAKIQPQIVHAGPDGLGPEMFGLPSVGPSVIPSYLTGCPSTEISKQQLCEVVDLFKAGCGAPRRPDTTGSSCMPRMATCCWALSLPHNVIDAPMTIGATPRAVESGWCWTRCRRLQRSWPHPQSHRGGRTRRVRYLRRQEKT
jgi:hypothetical protein